MNNARKQRKTIEWELLEIIFKKIGDIKGTFHARLGVTKDRNNKVSVRNLRRFQNQKRSRRGLEVCQEYTELYRKGFNDQDNHNGAVTHLDILDILGCKVKWALGSITMIKASGGDGIPAESFKILKDAAAKVLHSICQQIWKTH